MPPQFMDILSGLAPPMSLLLIGAALSLEVMHKNFYSVMRINEGIGERRAASNRE